MEAASTIIIEKQIMFLLNTKKQLQQQTRIFWKRRMASSRKAELLLNEAAETPN